MRHQLQLDTKWQCLTPIERSDFVRMGNDHDGGYVVPLQQLLACQHLVSAGIAYDWSFEQCCKHTVRDLTMVAWDGTTNQAHMTHQCRQEFQQLFSPPSVFHHWHVRPNEIEENLSWRQHCLVKLDIEGSEYDFVDVLVRQQARIQLLVVEFHELAADLDRFFNACQRLSMHFAVCHLHANNGSKIHDASIPDVIETTWVNRDSIQDVTYRSSIFLPGLDHPNCADKADIELVL